MARVLMPLPTEDFDPTESAVPWRVLVDAGHEVVFATPEGAPAAADEVVIRGPLGMISGSMKAGSDVVRIYREMAEDPAFLAPIAWADMDPDAVDALFLVGGHAPGMREYLESEDIRRVVLAMWPDRPVAAICHGVLVLARTVDPDTGRSVLDGRKTTCLPSYMERFAWRLTSWKLGRYYKTYDADVEEEVRDAVGESGEFVRGPVHLFSKGSEKSDAAAFIVEDGRYASGRWPGDAWRVGRWLSEALDHPNVIPPIS